MFKQRIKNGEEMMDEINFENLGEILKKALKNSYTPLFKESLSYDPAVDPGKKIAGPGIFASIPFQGSLNGILALHLSEDSGKSLVAQILGRQEASTEQAVQGIGELTKILAQGVQAIVGYQGLPLEMGLSQVRTTGQIDNSIFKPQDDSPWALIPTKIHGYQLGSYLSLERPKPNLRKRILIMEDNEIVIKVLHKTLEKRGYDVLLARNGAEGLKTAISYRCDLVFADMMMPDIDGPTAVKVLKIIKPNLPIVTYSALSRDEVIRLLGDAADHVKVILTKPASREKIIHAVELIIGFGNPVESSMDRLTYLQN